MERHGKGGRTIAEKGRRDFRHYLPVPGGGKFLRACGPSLEGGAVSQAPSPGNKPLFPRHPFTTRVGANPTIDI
ncbi:hypothetical protein JTE90_027987 [Oedothorax gibbosus]|uniref:Uncharacterized protein n=1 Tax=Oedothorax gibbosus TaxID=931172 RepID=A0AAV6TFI7_9ARAC|nr:hypothetical protein JTE90_027987 [Oedothorax gibbosus]